MAPATLEAPPTTEAGTIKLMSVYEKHRVVLEPVREVIDQHHGKYREPGSGKAIRFNNHRAEIPADWWPLLEQHSERPLQRGVVGPAERWAGMAPIGSGPQIVVGAQAASVQRVNHAPREGWDQATGREVIEWIEAGQVGDLEHAEAYEKAHQRRKMVVMALVKAQLGEDAAPEGEGIASTFSVPVPGGDGL